MSATPHLGLPLLAAAQAQKHVTHNEALSSIDALVHLAVKERSRTAAPAAPSEGDRYLVGSGATGVFAGHVDEIALFDLGMWRFFAPRKGWRAYVEVEDRIVVFNGTGWIDLGHYSRDLENVERLGIGTSADSLNRFSARLNAALFAALAADQGGSGDLRFVLNKSEALNVLSQLYQRSFSGRAETGLIGSDDFSIRVSPNGSEWRDALLVDRSTGRVSFPGGFPGGNLLINSAFTVNQRAFAGGFLAEGVYGFDRWKGGAGGCTLSRAPDGTVTLSGALDQVVDVAQAATIGAPNFAGVTLTLSVEEPSGPLPVAIGTRAATIPSGPGRRSVTVTLDGSETGHVVVRLHPGAACSFKRVRLEVGAHASQWAGEPAEINEMRCRRYYQRLATSGGAPSMLGTLGLRVAGNIIDFSHVLPVPMRAGPSLVTSGFSWSAGMPVGNQIGFYSPAGGGWISLTGSLIVTTAASTDPSSLVARLQAGSSFSGAIGHMGSLYLGNTAFIAVQAEL